MKAIYFFSMILSSSIIISCAKSLKKKEDFIPAVVDLAIRLKNDQPIELSTLYDSLISTIPADSVETLLLAEELKQRGFKVVNWGRGNAAPGGIRIVSLDLIWNNCHCSVTKIYYLTIQEGLYKVHESISCQDSRN